MTFKQIMGSLAFAALAMTALNVNAGNINANAARTVASNFIHQQAAKGSFRSHVALNDIKLVHAEASSAVKDANDYYAFNLTGGGFIIIAGEDRAATEYKRDEWKCHCDCSFLVCQLFTFSM